MKRDAWTQKTIESEKRRIKEELDARERREGPEGRFALALSRVRKLQEEASGIARLRCFIYVVSALLHASRHGGLKASQLNRLVTLGEALLAAQGVKKTSSRLSLLHGELYLAYSQCHRLAGNHWKAAWEHQISHYLSQRNPPGGAGFQLLSRGLRALRLGHGPLAVTLLDEAEREGLPKSSLPQARINLVRALRLAHDFDRAEQVLVSSLQIDSLSRDERRDLEWEGLCLQSIRSGTMEAIGRAVLPGRGHHDYAYLLEAFLWARVYADKTWMERLPAVRRLGYKLKLRKKEHGFLLECATVMERCYDARLPYLARLRALGKILSSTGALASIDKELLVWAAASRWLSRTKAYDIASLVLAEYRAAGLKLSQGRIDDPLNGVSDLTSRPWFRAGEEPARRKAG